MADYVKLEDVLKTLENASTTAARKMVLSKLAEDINELPRVQANDEVDLVTVLSFEAGQRASAEAMREKLKSIREKLDAVVELTKTLEKMAKS